MSHPFDIPDPPSCLPWCVVARCDGDGTGSCIRCGALEPCGGCGSCTGQWGHFLDEVNLARLPSAPALPRGVVTNAVDVDDDKSPPDAEAW